MPDQRKNFTSAHAACRALGSNTDLASIKNRQELGKLKTKRLFIFLQQIEAVGFYET